MPTEPKEIDYEAAYSGYLDRFEKRFGERPTGTFVKFNKHMVQRLGPDEFAPRLHSYVKLHKACKKMLETGATISDALVLDFVEASAWIAVEAPNMYAMFNGELGDPKLAAPDRVRASETDATDPDIRPGESRDTARITLTPRSRGE